MFFRAGLKSDFFMGAASQIPFKTVSVIKKGKGACR
jgi:hypothetical protein